LDCRWHDSLVLKLLIQDYQDWEIEAMTTHRTLAGNTAVIESSMAKLLEAHRKLYSSWIVDWEQEQRKRLDSLSRNTVTSPHETSQEIPPVRLVSNL
jgi:hypothetical protein